ncbi:GNAT family N-acetyltransferase [Aestuariibacter sp. A3R04]|uniref:GNAT family N-acetyltransferase n=1 Tax=Aestuariibacter sp. A3R04 TaxID=2841571 RepID=UPI001C097A39|nr:GNAT family N-acetyltransferase [Aestuariibacter sp. A3R04]
MNVADSSRLSFHFITADDADFLWSLDQDEEVMRYLTGGRKTTREEINHTFLPRLAAFSQRDKGWGLWRVAEKGKGGNDLGWILVRPMGFFSGERDDENIELGWRFRRVSWGRGVATEAARQVKQCLVDHGYRRFSAIALPENRGSIAVMKKLGLTFSHHFRYTDDVFDEDVVVYEQHFDTE